MVLAVRYTVMTWEPKNEAEAMAGEPEHVGLWALLRTDSEARNCAACVGCMVAIAVGISLAAAWLAAP